MILSGFLSPLALNDKPTPSLARSQISFYLLLSRAILTPFFQLSTQTLQSTQSHRRRTQLVTDHVTLEIERLKDVMRQCDELQNEFLKIKRIGEIVKGFRQRVEVLEKRVGR